MTRARGQSVVAAAALACGALVGLCGCDGTRGVLLIRGDSGATPAATAGAPGVQPSENPYVPAEGARWLAQLDGAVDIEQPAEFFYLDAEQQDAEDLEELHRQGRHYLCYLSVGSFEEFRPDADTFPPATIGKPLADFPRERWIDVRDASVRAIMARRIERLAALGCDGVPPASLSVHAADTGFDLTLEDALDYARWIAERVHAAGMSVGLSAPESMTAELWPSFDFGLGIGCVAATGCSELEVLRTAQKPVLYVELGDAETAEELCKSAKILGFEALVTDAGFGGQCIDCRDIL
jgi:Glycoside-hydrolase family GH114